MKKTITEGYCHNCMVGSGIINVEPDKCRCSCHKRKDWANILYDCPCGRKCEWRVHGVKDDAWIEKTK